MPGVVAWSRACLCSLVIAGALVQSNIAAAAAPADTTGWTVPMTPFQASVFKPAQIFSPATPVRGMRVNLLYGEQASLWGIDVGLGFNETTSEMLGLQLAPATLNQDFAGFQAGGVNRIGGNFAGFQVGVVNVSEGNEQSVQSGLRVNLLFGHLATFWGLDLGLCNMTSREMGGLQTGLVNTNLGSASAVQLGWANWVSGTFMGFQNGLINVVEAGEGGSSYGAQLGFVNSVGGDFTGLQSGFLNMIGGGRWSVQLGFFNQAKSLRGVQIGAINVNLTPPRPLRFVTVLPVVNVGW